MSENKFISGRLRIFKLDNDNLFAWKLNMIIPDVASEFALEQAGKAT